MPKVYAVRIESVAIITADNLREALYVAADRRSEMVQDDPNPKYRVEEVRCLADLPELWDGTCLAYNGREDVEQRLDEVLPATRGQPTGKENPSA